MGTRVVAVPLLFHVLIYSSFLQQSSLSNEETPNWRKPMRVLQFFGPLPCQGFLQRSCGEQRQLSASQAWACLRASISAFMGKIWSGDRAKNIILPHPTPSEISRKVSFSQIDTGTVCPFYIIFVLRIYIFNYLLWFLHWYSWDKNTVVPWGINSWCSYTVG